MKIEYLQDINEIDELVSLFKTVLFEIPYYNDLAKQNELKHYTKNNLIEKIKEDPKSIIIARENDELIGFCFNRFDDYTIWLEWIVLKRNLKRTGVGKLLIEKLVDATKERNCHKIWCDCRTTNNVSKNFLKKNGFELICEIPNHWYQQDFVLLQKPV